mmetsp:Transcript_2852/g.4863  ORF Transcript_2852/g.4863 Transcript_2852/m.4863 type:complete len:144 (+) Transcript_2852:1036-1467(+)
MDRTQTFIKKIIERPHVPVKRQESTLIGKQNNSPQIRLYRNAELVAKYYKYLGLLPQEGASFKLNVKYEPQDFTHNSNFSLGMKMQASLGDEYSIMFNEKDIQGKLKKYQNHLEAEVQEVISKTQEKFSQDMNLSCISEKDIE